MDYLFCAVYYNEFTWVNQGVFKICSRQNKTLPLWRERICSYSGIQAPMVRTAYVPSAAIRGISVSKFRGDRKSTRLNSSHTS